MGFATIGGNSAIAGGIALMLGIATVGGNAHAETIAGGVTGLLILGALRTDVFATTRVPVQITGENSLATLNPRQGAEINRAPVGGSGS